MSISDRKYAAESCGAHADLVLAAGTLNVAALRWANHSLPIVFVGVSDPVGAGFVDTLARPGGNGSRLYAVSSIVRVGNGWNSSAGLHRTCSACGCPSRFRDPAGIAQFGAIQAVAGSLGVEVRPD